MVCLKLGLNYTNKSQAVCHGSRPIVTTSYSRLQTIVPSSLILAGFLDILNINFSSCPLLMWGTFQTILHYQNRYSNIEFMSWFSIPIPNSRNQCCWELTVKIYSFLVSSYSTIVAVDLLSRVSFLGKSWVLNLWTIFCRFQLLFQNVVCYITFC